MRHILAVRPTTMMGRLPKLLGQDVGKRLIDEVYRGDFKALREDAFYTKLDRNGLKTPETVVFKDRAREVLLLALESADDILVGYSDASFQIGHEIEKIFVTLNRP